MSQRVVILGASEKPERYSNKAMHMLNDYGHKVVLVSPRVKSIVGATVLSSLSEVTGSVDTLTMYVGAQVSAKMADEIIKLKPRRVIFNPGSENPDLQHKLAASGIAVEEACTLVLLRTNQFAIA